MAEKEYIEREDLLDRIGDKPLFTGYEKTHTFEQHQVLCACIDAMKWLVKRIPASDVVQIVRCKDCKYYEKITNTGKNGCEMWCCRCGALAKIKQDGESFCSYGERREQ